MLRGARDSEYPGCFRWDNPWRMAPRQLWNANQLVKKRTAQLFMHLEDRHHMGSKALLRKSMGSGRWPAVAGVAAVDPARLSPLRPRSLVSFAIDQSRMRLRSVLWLRLSHLLPWHDEAQVALRRRLRT